MRGALIGTSLLACVAIAGCGGNSGNTTIINNNQTTVTTAAGSTSTTSAPTTTATAPVPDTTTPEKVEKPEPPKPGPVACGDPAIVTGGSPASDGSPAKPGFANLQAQGMSCAVATSIATAWADGFEVSACGAGCVKEVGDLRCRYAGSGSAVGCYGTKDEQLMFDLAFPD